MSSFSAEAIERLARARTVTVLTGAGASAESGIPTFRDPGGLWDGVNPVELASVQGFRANPVRVQSWYSARIAAARRVEPNLCHRALADLEQRVDEVVVITQNVDGLHQRAGSTTVIELHGSLTDIHCILCGQRTDRLEVAVDAATPAVCRCGGLLRPGVVWFGEMLPEREVEAAFSAAKRADVMLSVGTSGEVYPAAGLPLVASEYGAYVIEVNLGPTALSDIADEAVYGPAGSLLPELVQSISRPDVRFAQS